MFPPKSAVEEALKGPETLSPPKTEEEAVERKPPWRVERFLTNNVLEAFRAPDSCSPPTMEEEAVERKPPPSVERLVPVTVNTPPTSTELEADTGPWMFRFFVKVEEAVEREPP